MFVPMSMSIILTTIASESPLNITWHVLQFFLQIFRTQNIVILAEVNEWLDFELEFLRAKVINGKAETSNLQQDQSLSHQNLQN
jgi:hypothetical protein